MDHFSEIRDLLHKGGDINDYLDNLLQKIAISYFKDISFKEWVANKWLNYKEHVEISCKEIYKLEKGYWNELLLDMDDYINNWLINPNSLDLIINLRELINILYIYNKREYLKLKSGKTNKEKKLLKKLNKETKITEYLIKINDYFYPNNNQTHIDYYDSNLKILKKLKSFLSKPLHAYSIFYENSFSTTEQTKDFERECNDLCFALLDKILEVETDIYNNRVGINIPNTYFSSFGAFFDYVQINGLHSIIEIQCVSLLDTLLEKFNDRLEERIDSYKQILDIAK